MVRCCVCLRIRAEIDLRMEYKRHYARICVNSFAQFGLRTTEGKPGLTVGLYFRRRQAPHTPPHDVPKVL